MKMTRWLAQVLAAAAFLPTAQAQPWPGPFGVEMGIDRARIERLVGNVASTRFVLLARTAPNPHPLLANYVYRFGSSGLCRVSGIADAIETNAFGTQVKGVYQTLKDALTRRYGKPTGEIDMLRPGSIWRDAGDWTMALSKEDRRLVAYWAQGEQGLKLPNHIDGIILEAKAHSPHAAQVELAYSFENEDRCAAEAERERDKAL